MPKVPIGLLICSYNVKHFFEIIAILTLRQYIRSIGQVLFLTKYSNYIENYCELRLELVYYKINKSLKNCSLIGKTETLNLPYTIEIKSYITI